MTTPLTPLACMTVCLARRPTDPHLVQYARMLAERGVVQKLQFAHVRSDDESPDGLAAADARVVADETTRQLGEVAARIATTFTVRDGECLDEILRFADQHPADALLLGHRASNGGRRSLARRLAMMAPSSVWMVPTGAPLDIRRVLAPIDFSPPAADSLSYAARIARLAGLDECLALHVSFSETAHGFPDSVARRLESERQAYGQFVRPVATYGAKVTPLIEEGSGVSRTVLRVADERQCDLIVMSTRGRSRSASILLGSETSRTLAESHVPVLAVKHFGAQLNLFQAFVQHKLGPQSDPQTN